MTTHGASHQVEALCSTYSLRELYLFVGLMLNEFSQFDAVIRQSRRLKKDEFLLCVGEPLTSLFAIRAGFLKTTVASQDGRDQVTDFLMSGELIGMDGICPHTHSCDAVVLEDSEVCELPFGHIEELGQNILSLQTRFSRLLSREIVHDQGMMPLLDNMRAEECLAAFLLNLSNCLYPRGFAADDFVLRMSCREIDSYLGLKSETVSHMLSRFYHDGLTRIEHKHIKILELQTLKEMVSGCTHAMQVRAMVSKRPSEILFSDGPFETILQVGTLLNRIIFHN